MRVTVAGEPVRWQTDAVSVVFDDSLALLGEPEAVQEAIVASLQTWEESGVLPVRFAVGTSSGAAPGFDPAGPNANQVLALEGPWPYDPSWPAVTITTYDDVSGELLDADIVFDASRRWSASESPAAAALDIQDVATHEIGHLLGLEHSEVPEATMYGEGATGSTVRRSLHFDDVEGVVAAYGPPELLGREVTGGCSAAPGGAGGDGLAALAAALLGLAVGRMRGRR